MKELEITELSDRELEILRLVATGASNKEIAKKLFISPNTVKVHLRNIFEKIGVVSRTEAAMYAVKIGLSSFEGPVVSSSISENATGENSNNLPIAQTVPSATSQEIPQFHNPIQVWLPVTGIIVILIIVGLLFSQSLLASVNSRQQTSPTASAIDRWNRLADMPSGRFRFAVAAGRDKIFIIGGQLSDSVTGDVKIYDPLVDKWESGKSKPIPVSNIQAAIIAGKIIVPGGRTSTGKPTNKVEAYDPFLDAWEELNPLPEPLSDYALASMEGRIYLFGGWNGSKPEDTIFEYNNEDDQWITIGSLSSPRMNAGAATADENIYLIGGDDGERAISTTEVFYPGQALTRGPLWEKRMSLPVACRISGIEVIANNIFSLCNNEAGSIFSYSPATDTWQSFTEPKPVDLPQESTIVFHDNYLYYIGGISKSGTPSAANWSNQIFYTLLIPYLKK